VALGKIGVFNKGMRCFRNQPTIPKVVRRPTLTSNTHPPHHHIPQNQENCAFPNLPKRGGGEMVVALGKIGVFHKGTRSVCNQPAIPTVVRRPTLTPNTHPPHHHIPQNQENCTFLNLPKRGGGEMVVALGKIGVFHKGIGSLCNQPAIPTVVRRPTHTPNTHPPPPPHTTKSSNVHLSENTKQWWGGDGGGPK
jgi:hypothetical protein